MRRFRLIVTDVFENEELGILENATDVSVDTGLNEVSTLTFSLSAEDAKSDLLQFRRVVRLEEDLNPYSTPYTDLDAAQKTITISNPHQFAQGDFILLIPTPSLKRQSIARILSITGQGNTSLLSLSRIDGVGASSTGTAEKVGFRSFRVKELNWERDNNSLATIRCTASHIASDLADIEVLQAGRHMLSATLQSGTEVEREITPDEVVDAILKRMPLYKPFIKGSVEALERREFSATSPTALNALDEISRTWSTDSRFVFWRVNEDRSIDIVAKSGSDANDPTSDLVISYNRNSVSFSRDEGVRDFANVLIPYGSQNQEIAICRDLGTVEANPASPKQRNSNIRFWASDYAMQQLRIGDKLKFSDFDAGNPELTGTVTSATNTSITDSSKSWTKKSQLDKSICRFLSGPLDDYAIRIDTFSSDTLNFKYPLPVTDPSTLVGSNYIIYNKTASTEGVTGAGLKNGRVYGLVGTDNSGVNDKATSMTDTTKDFSSLGVEVGMRIFNATDGSEGSITGITTTTNPNDTITFNSLTGGAENDFDDGDSYNIAFVHSNYFYFADDRKRGIPADEADAYQGGLLTFLSGDLRSVEYRIVSNTSDGVGRDIIYLEDASFDAYPKAQDEVSIVGAPTRVSMHGVDEGENITMPASTTVRIFTLRRSEGNSWANGWIVCTKGTGEFTQEQITGSTYFSTLGYVEIYLASPTTFTVDATSEVMLWKINGNLPVDVAEIRSDDENYKSLQEGHRILKLMTASDKLTIGKSRSRRVFVNYASEDMIKVYTDDPFEDGAIISVSASAFGEKGISSINRSRQDAYQIATVEEVSPLGYPLSLALTSKLDIAPQPYDEVELLSVQDTASIDAYGRVERVEDLNSTDPNLLYDEAVKLLASFSSFSPSYRIDFLSLYEVDKEGYQYDSFSLGDTITMKDEDLKIDSSDFLIRKLTYNPDLPYDKQIEVMQVRSAIPAKPESLDEEVLAIKETLRALPDDIVGAGLGMPRSATSAVSKPTCIFWDNATKSCIRPIPPNNFCEGRYGGNNGRTTYTGKPLSPGDCIAFTSSETKLSNIVNTNINRQRKFVSVVGTGDWQEVNPTSYITPADGADFIVDSAYAILVEVEDAVGPAYAADYSSTKVRVKTDDLGRIDTENSNGKLEDGRGFIIEVLVPSGSTYHLYVEWFAEGGG